MSAVTSACVLCLLCVGTVDASGLPFSAAQQQPTAAGTPAQPGGVAAPVQPQPTSGAATTMQQVVSQLRAPPVTATTVAGQPAMRLQGIRLQGPPMAPGTQQVTRVRIQGSQPGQAQQVQILGNNAPKPATTTQMQQPVRLTIASAAGGNTMAASTQIVTSGNGQPRMVAGPQEMNGSAARFGGPQADVKPAPGFPQSEAQPPQFPSPGTLVLHVSRTAFVS